MQLISTPMEFDTWHDVVREYIDRGWTDGLPIIPPTPDMVAASLEAAGRNPSEVLGTEPTKGRVITAEKAAVNAVMAGCKPEYFSIVATAVEAMCEPDFNLHAVTASTQGAARPGHRQRAYRQGHWTELVRQHIRPRTHRQRHDRPCAKAGHHQRDRLGLRRDRQSHTGAPGQIHLVHRRGGRRLSVGTAAGRQGLLASGQHDFPVRGTVCYSGGQSRLPETGGDSGLVQRRHVRRRRRIEPGRGRGRPLS